MIQFIGKYVGKHWQKYLLIAVLIVVYDVTLLVPTQVIQRLVDQLSQESLTHASLVRDLVVLGGATLINYGSAYWWHYKLFQASVDFKLGLQQQSFRKMLIMRTPFYEKFRSGDMLTRFSTDVEGLMEMVGYGLMIVVYAGGMIAFILPAMSLISGKLTLLAMLPMAVMIAVTYWVSKQQDVVIEANREAVAELNNEVLEAIEGVRVTRAYSKKAVQESRFQAKTKALRQTGVRNVTLQALYNPIATVMLACSTILVLWFGAEMLQKGQVSLGQLLALQLYTASLLEPFWMLSDFILVYQTGKTSYEKITELLETGDDLEVDGQLLANSPAVYAFEGYDFTYPQAERPSLSAINWTLQKGQTVGIVGKTGSGKTTLVRQFLRQYPLGQGSFTVDKAPMAAYKRRSIEELIGYVPQEHVLFSRSVRENIALGNPAATEEAILAAVETAAFNKDLAVMSHGLDTLIGERGVAISGGQKQRISIARAFLRQPELLILDDSLSAVDAKTEREIIANIQRERADKTTVIVTHRLSAVHHADWVLVLDQGKIVEEGRPEDLLGQGGWYFEQYQRQQDMEGGEA